MQNNPHFGTYLYSLGTCHENLLKLLVTMHRVTYFIMWPHQKLCEPKLTIKRLAEDMEKKIKVNRPWQ